MMGFLARWARRLSWRETARAFQTSWELRADQSVLPANGGVYYGKLEGLGGPVSGAA